MPPMSRRRFARLLVGTGLGGGFAAVLAACGDEKTGDQLREKLDRYAKGLGEKNAFAAAEVTDLPSRAAEDLTKILRDMAPQSLAVTVVRAAEIGDTEATFTLRSRWDFGHDRIWEYDTTGMARKVSNGWRLSWDLAMVAPGMVSGAVLKHVRVDASPVPSVLARDGSDLMFQRRVADVVLTPAGIDVPASCAALSAAIAAVAPEITPESLQARADARPGEPIDVITLRNEDFVVLEAGIRAVPGVTVTELERLVLANRGVVSPAIDSIAAAWQAQQDTVAGWAVERSMPDGSVDRLIEREGVPGLPLATNFDYDTQQLAYEAVLQVGQPAAMVVLEPSSGAVLAVAQNGQASEFGPTSLTGLFPPGPVLDPAFGAINPIAGADPTRQRDMLAQLGIGTVFAVRGLDQVTGKGPTDAGIAAAELSRDNVTVTAFGLAVAAASVAVGATVSPAMIAAEPAAADRPVGPIDPAVLAAIRTAMEPNYDTADLTASGIQCIVGTQGPEGPGWLWGFVGDRAIAILVSGPQSGAGALQVAGYYLGV